MLHHYDEIGLLKPAFVGENRYRYYGREELLRLQQILFHREFGFSLQEVAELLDRSNFDRVDALKAHRTRLEIKAKGYRQLIRTIDRTIAELEGDRAVRNSDLYKGFSPEKQVEHEAWLIERYGGDMHKHFEAGRTKMDAMSDAEKQVFFAEIGEIEQGLGDAFANGLPADGKALAPLMRRHHAWVGRTWAQPPNAEAYAGLADLYVAHPDFRERYEAIRPGFPDFLMKAMKAFAKQELEK